jgi:hypothetical protein
VKRQGRSGDREFLGQYLQTLELKGGQIVRQTVVRAWDE